MSFSLQELELYNQDMLEKPAVLALNKIDTDPGGKLTDSIVQLIKNLPGMAFVDDEFLSFLFYAPKEVGRAYCFCVVHSFVRLSRFLMHAISYKPCMLGF